MWARLSRASLRFSSGSVAGFAVFALGGVSTALNGVRMESKPSGSLVSSSSAVVGRIASPLHKETEFDVAIVGGGIVGLA